MAALQSDGVAPPLLDHASKSFASMLVDKSIKASLGSDIGKSTTFKGETLLCLSWAEMLSIASPYANALVGRFVAERPSVETIRKFVVFLGLKGECPVGLLDSKHMLLRPMMAEDFTRLWFRSSWYIGNFHMAIWKWTVNFRPDQDSSLAPVWISFPGLPIPFFDKQYLLKLGGLIGRLLKIDEATALLKRPSVACMLVEIDIRVEPKPRLWIGDEH